MRHVPFEVRRIFYIYNIPENGARGGHAHKLLHQFIIPIAGRFDVIVNDGVDKKEFHLSAPDVGLHVPPMFWVDMVRFAAGSLPLVLASDWYDESDYYRDFDAFRAAAVQCA